MAIKYETIVPWGRSFKEYSDMFSLTEVDLCKSILGCGDGPASFNSTMRQKGKRVVSIDPIYQFTKDEISNRIIETYQNVINQTNKNRDRFVWTKIKDIEELGKIRMTAMEQFLTDYDAGKKEKRYIFAELPNLPFDDKQFDLSLASHFLFLYTENLSFKFHVEAINEMLRVSREVRIFPLLNVNSEKSIYVDKVIEKFTEMGYRVEEVTVNYEFQKGGNKMLRIVYT